MKLQEFLDKLKENELPLILLDGKPLRGYVDADTEEGWVLVPDLSNAVVAGLVDNPDPQAPKTVQLGTKKLTGKVEFWIARKKVETTD